MNNLTNAVQQLTPKVGFRDTVAFKEYLPLSDDIIATPSNGELYVNSVNEFFLSTQKMSDCLEFIEGYNFDAYSATIDYEVGDYVLQEQNGVNYILVCLQQNGPSTSLKPPLTEPEFWESYLSKKLREYRETAASETLYDTITAQSNSTYSPEIIKSSLNYAERSVAQPTQLRGRFVAIEIIPPKYKTNRVLDIDTVHMHITGTTEPVTLYLYHSSRNEAIQTFVVSDIVNDGKWYTITDNEGNSISLNNYTKDYNNGGRFYLGFYENLLAPGQGYKHHELTSPIAGLNQSSYKMRGVEVQNQNLNGVLLPDLKEYYDSVEYNDELPLSYRYQESQSYEPLIIDNITLFIKAYQYKLAIVILTDMMLSDRISRVSDNAQSKIDELLYGDPEKPNNKGIVKMHEEHFKKLIMDFSVLFDDKRGLVQGPY